MPRILDYGVFVVKTKMWINFKINSSELCHRTSSKMSKYSIHEDFNLQV